MNQGDVSVTLSEWQTLTPENTPHLRDVSLGDGSDYQSTLHLLHKSNKVSIRELRTGVEITARSHVGRIQLGKLEVTIQPKIESGCMLRLLRYAYGFRGLHLYSRAEQLTSKLGFADLLISQLLQEAQELISRGLRMSYVRQDERLASPRGRIDIGRLALEAGSATATLPCQHFPRLEDTLINQVLLGGLRLAANVASLLELRRDASRLASQMDEQVSPIKLESAVMSRLSDHQSRLTQAYDPAIEIIRLLMESQGITLDGKTMPTQLPGFLFDMNTFFQAFVSRFLNDYLPNYSVHDEHGLKGMMRYDSKHNPRRRQSPTPRPDFVVKHRDSVVAILDAKYRDLWERSLPRDILYQLVIYAMSHPGLRSSTIIYPTTSTRARPARVNVTDPVRGQHLGRVWLRPLNLGQLDQLLSSAKKSCRRECEEIACRLVG